MFLIRYNKIKIRKVMFFIRTCFKKFFLSFIEKYFITAFVHINPYKELNQI